MTWEEAILKVLTTEKKLFSPNDIRVKRIKVNNKYNYYSTKYSDDYELNNEP